MVNKELESNLPKKNTSNLYSIEQFKNVG